MAVYTNRSAMVNAANTKWMTSIPSKFLAKTALIILAS